MKDGFSFNRHSKHFALSAQQSAAQRFIENFYIGPCIPPCAVAAPARRCGSWRACGRRPGRCCSRGRRWPACCRLATRASASAPRTTGPGAATRCSCRWRPPAGASCAPVLARAVHAPCPGAVATPARQCGSWKAVPTSIGSVAAVAGDVDAGQVLDARAALAGAIAVGVLQDGHQGECIGAAHYRGGAHQAPLQMAADRWCARRSGPGQDGAYYCRSNISSSIRNCSFDFELSCSGKTNSVPCTPRKYAGKTILEYSCIVIFRSANACLIVRLSASVPRRYARRA